MGQESCDNLNASLAHVILCCVAGNGIGQMRASTTSYSDPGMHANYFIHGTFGFFHYQGGLLNNDFGAAYTLSLKASRCLPLPCLMADLYRENNNLSVLHLASGAIPFILTLSGQDNSHLTNLMLACNIISLAHYSIQSNHEWGWYTAGAAIFAYFCTPQMGSKVMYPLGLALMEYCAYKVYYFHSAAAADPPPPPPRRR